MKSGTPELKKMEGTNGPDPLKKGSKGHGSTSDACNLIGSPFLGIQPMKKCPHARLRAPVLERYDAFECIFMTRSDTWNLIVAS